MIPDEQFRRTFDLLAERVIEDINTQLKRVGDELGGAHLAARDKAVADASITARTEAEKLIAERTAAAEQRAQEAVASADARVREATEAADERVRNTLEAAEARARDVVAAAEAKARNEIAAAEARAHEAVNRAESLVQETMTAAEARARESVAAAESQARNALSAAEGRALEAVAAVEARARVDLDTSIARVRAEALGDAVSASDRLLSAIRAIDAGQSLSDIMTTLLRSACLEAQRVAIFVRDGEALRSWKLIGFNEHGEEESGMPLALADAGIIGDALANGEPVMAGHGRTGRAPAFAALPDDSVALAFPLVISREAIGVLYADAGPTGGDGRSLWAPIVEVLGRHAARAPEVLTASKLLAQAMANRSAQPLGRPPQPTSTPPRSTLGLR